MMHALTLLCLTMLVMPGQIKRIIDADTFSMWAFGPVNEERVRVLGVDAIELRAPGGREAREFTVLWLMQGPFELMTCTKDSFGRWLGTASRDEEDLAQVLIHNGHGVAYTR